MTVPLLPFQMDGMARRIRRGALGLPALEDEGFQRSANGDIDPGFGKAQPGAYDPALSNKPGADLPTPGKPGQSNLGEIIRKLAYGLSGTPRGQGGFSDFLGGAGRGFVGVDQLEQRDHAREQDEEDRRLTLQEQIRQRLRQEDQDEFNRANVEADNARADRTAAATEEERQYNRTRDTTQDEYRRGRDVVEDRHAAAVERRLGARGGADDSPTPLQQANLVGSQIDDTRAEISQAQRGMPEFIDTPEERTLAKQIADRIAGLQGRADSLTNVRDSLAGRIQGRQPTAPKRTPADRWEELVNGGMSEAEATAKVKQEFRLP